MKTMAILIDAEAQEIREVEVQNLEDWQRLVGGKKGPTLVEVYYARWLPKHVILVDENGRVRNPLNFGFTINGSSAQLGGDRVIGNGLVMRDSRPNFRAPAITIPELTAMVKWWRE